jgi:drug/metabolite transporter (DMT)-like permease
MLLTGVLNGIYFVALGQAYQRMPAAVVYPVARSSPLLLVAVEVGWFAVPLGYQRILAIILATSRILLLARSLTATGNRKGIWFALLAAMATTGYTLSDQQAARSGIDSIPAGLGYVCGTYAIAWIIMSGQRWLQGVRVVPPRPPWLPTLLAAACVGGAYALVIGAVTWTNMGMIIGVILAIIFLRERERISLRLTAVAVTIGGLILLAVAH